MANPTHVTVGGDKIAPYQSPFVGDFTSRVAPCDITGLSSIDFLIVQVVEVTYNGSPRTISSITRNGQNFVQLSGAYVPGAGIGGVDGSGDFWYLADPDIGDYDATITFNANTNACVAQFEGYAGVTGIALGDVKSTVNSTEPAVFTPASTDADSIIIAGFLMVSTDSSLSTPDSPATTLDETDIGSFIAGSAFIGLYERVCTGASQTLTVQHDVDDWVGHSIVITGATVGGAYSIDAEPGAFVLAGVNAALIKSKIIDAQAAAFTLSGIAAVLARGRNLDAQVGAFALAGVNAGLFKGKSINALAGAFALTGINAGLVKTKIINAQPGSFTFTGQGVLIYKSKVVLASPGAFALAGQNADIEFVGVENAYSIDAEPGAFALEGVNATIIKNYLLVAEPGNFALSGQAAEVNRNRNLDAEAGAFALAGVSANISKSKAIDAEPGAFVLEGMAAILTYSEEDPVEGDNPIVSVLVYSKMGAKQ